MKKLFFILTSLFFFSCPLKAAAFDCAQLNSNPAIVFSTSYGKLAYDYTKNNDQITAVASRYGIAEKGLFASGLATVNVVWEITVSSMGKVYGDYNVCVVPTEINVFIGFDQPTIYISRDLAKNSCEYNVVMRHEQTHQQINKSALDYFLPLFQDALEKIADTIKPVTVAHITQIDDATNRLTREYNKKLSPLIEVFKNELLTEQSKLDNRTNYQHEKELCK